MLNDNVVNKRSEGGSSREKEEKGCFLACTMKKMGELPFEARFPHSISHLDNDDREFE
jgi:hypothetical protein